MMTTIRRVECTATAPVLLRALELGQRAWKIGFTTSISQRPRLRSIGGGAVGTLVEEIAGATQRFGVATATPVISCYEAGRDGFWLHRFLTTQGVTNYVVDSASIEVNRRARRAKTDRLDRGGLLNLLARDVQGDRRCWRIVRVPTLAEEDARPFSRAWETLTQDRTRLTVVSAAVRQRWSASASHRDRRPRAQITHCPVALRRSGRDAARCSREDRLIASHVAAVPRVDRAGVSARRRADSRT